MQKLEVFCFMLCLTSPVSMACQSPDPESWEASANRVKANFDDAQFVAIADVMNVNKVSVEYPAGSDFWIKVERARFRIAHAFKGSVKPGDTFQIDSGTSSCARGVLDSEWALLRAHNSAYPERWLIYYTPSPVLPGPGPQPPPFEITGSSLSRPASLATYDIDVLKRSAGKWRGGIKR